MKKYLFLILTILLLIPINVFAGVCEPDKISIESITLEDITGNATEKEEASINGKSINLNLHMKGEGDSIDYKIVVKNDSEEDYLLNEDSFNLSSDYIDYSITTEDDTNIVPAKDKKNVYLRVEYKEEVPTNELTGGVYTDNNTMNVTMTSNSTTPSTNTDPVVTPTPNSTITPVPIVDNNPINVPNTYASTSTLFIVLTVILFGVALYYCRKNKTVSIVLTVLGVILITSSKSSFALCSTSISIESNIEIGNTYTMFLPGPEVNARMKKFVNPDATYESTDNTITSIIRYIGTPDASNTIDENIVSTEDSGMPIYMWYDSDNTTIYWYTEAKNIYYNPDSSYHFSRLRAVDSISNLDDISSEYTTNMSNMFNYTGYSSTVFTLDLGDKFDTSNVTDMNSMFRHTGNNSAVFILDLGHRFDTSNVRDMYFMFGYTGSKSTIFTLDLGDKFNTSNVTSMKAMFVYLGYSNTSFTLDLGDKFDTSNVTDMASMFNSTGYNSTVFTLDLGDKFNTSKATTMTGMFANAGAYSPVFTLNLGDKFDTSNVTSMGMMFAASGYSNPSFTLDLGDKFDTSKVTNMESMFNSTGYSNPSFTLDLGDKFDTSIVTDMSFMFNKFNGITIYAPSSFVTTASGSTNMFKECPNLVGGAGTVWSSSHIDASYAHIDGGTDNPGYFTIRGAVFKSGQEVNARMKQFVISTAAYNTSDSTITDIVRFIGTPNSVDMIDNNIVSIDSSLYPIYMWYDSENAIIYWYTESTNVYYNPDSSYFYANIKGLNTISCMNDISSIFVTNMKYMFYFTGSGSSTFTIDLGDQFDTRNVTTMYGMFYEMGSSNPSFTLDLGDKFDTSNVTMMFAMFYDVGFASTVFTLNLGDKFDTSNVTSMSVMFSRTGQSNTNFVLDLGDKFNTENVQIMTRMFEYFKGPTIYAPTSFVTTSVTNSADMFNRCNNLVGGAGTAYTSSHKDATYAHIDEVGNPGYFTARQ